MDAATNAATATTIGTEPLARHGVRCIVVRKTCLRGCARIADGVLEPWHAGWHARRDGASPVAVFDGHCVPGVVDELRPACQVVGRPAAIKLDLNPDH